MKNAIRIIVGSSCCALALSFLLGASAPKAPPGFSVHDLHGRYAFVISGQVTQGPIQGALAAVGYIEADGHGNFPFATRTLTVGGTLVVQNDTATGTYTVNPDGTGTATFLATSGGPPQTFDFVITNSHDFFAVATSPGVVASGPAQR